MTNELLIEALDYGLIMEEIRSKNFYLSCSHMVCIECKFDNLVICDFLLTKENLKFIKENYPEVLL